MNPAVNRRQFIANIAALPFLSQRAANRRGLRVAAMDWALAETMIALGHHPIAIVAASDWNRFVVEPPLSAGIADLGLQPEINFELLASLRPDLILTSPFVERLEPILQRIAPVARFSIFEPTTIPLAQPRTLTRSLGERLNRVDEAEDVLTSADRMLDSYRARIAAIAPPPVLLVNFIDARHVRVYGGAGLYQNVLDRIGVRNAWTDPTNYWGYSTIGIEKLATNTDLRLVAFEPVPPDARPTLARSPLWSRLPFVRAGHVAVLPSVLMFGAMPSALRFARLLVEHLERLPR